MFLIELPSEIQLDIIDHLRTAPIGIPESRSDTAELAPLLLLSRTCSLYRGLLVPHLFKSITLRNTEKSARSIREIAKGDACAHVKELRFIGSAAPGRGEKAYADIESVMSDNVYDILSHLSMFPNLGTLTVGFEFTRNWTRGHREFETRELYETVDKNEERVGWRALMSLTWSAIARNRTFDFGTLNLPALVPKEVSAFSTPEFRRMLSSVESFSLSAYGSQIARPFNTVRGVRYFYERLDEFFFNHLKNVKRLRVAANGNCHLGMGATDHHIPLALNRYHLPFLESVHLDHVFICASLLEFLGARTKTLREVVLRDCMGSVCADGTDVEGTKWKDLFLTLSSRDPQRLRHFSIEPLIGVTVLEDEGELLFKETGEGDSLNGYAFTYRSADGAHGYLHDTRDVTREEFQQGNDLKEYDKLVKLVRANNNR